MADIQDVMDKLDDVLDKVADNKEKIDEVLAKDEIWKICGTCKGTGEEGVHRDPEVVAPCPVCNGKGWVATESGEEKIPARKPFDEVDVRDNRGFQFNN